LYRAEREIQSRVVSAARIIEGTDGKKLASLIQIRYYESIRRKACSIISLTIRSNEQESQAGGLE
jgi:hypothetical protein